jgi:hypothetical protein
MAKLKQLNEQEMSESKKRFKKLLEYSYINKEDDLLLDEDDELPEVPGEEPAAAPGPGGEAPIPPEDLIGGPKASENSAVMGGGPAPEPTSNEPNISTEPAPEAEIDIQPEPIPNPEAGGDEVEIDVTDLTQKQDEVDNKVSDITNQTNQMMGMLTQLTDKIDSIKQQTSTEINTIKDEIVKRNPTPVEVLQKRITVSDPFSETPEQYWDKKQSEGHYKLSDEDEDKGQYDIKSSDIDTNYSDIYKSFGLSDNELNQSLATMFK